MLILCPECQLQISDKAISCPHCGYPLKPEKAIKHTISDLTEAVYTKRDTEWLRSEIEKIKGM